MEKNTAVTLQTVALVLQIVSLIIIVLATLIQQIFTTDGSRPVIPFTPLLETGVYFVLMLVSLNVIRHSRPDSAKNAAITMLIVYLIICILMRFAYIFINMMLFSYAEQDSLGRYYMLVNLLNNILSFIQPISVALYLFSLGIFYRQQDSNSI